MIYYIILSASEAVLTSTHNLSFGAKIRKIGIPLQTPFFNIKVGFNVVYFTWTCFPDANMVLEICCAHGAGSNKETSWSSSIRKQEKL